MGIKNTAAKLTISQTICKHKTISKTEEMFTYLCVVFFQLWKQKSTLLY